MRSQREPLVDLKANALATKSPPLTADALATKRDPLTADALATKSDPITLAEQVVDALATMSPQVLLRQLRLRVTSLATTKSNLRNWSSTLRSMKMKLSWRQTTLSRTSLACTRGRQHEQTPKGFRRNVRYSRIHSVTPPYSVSFHSSVYRLYNGSSGIAIVKPVMMESLLINLGKLAFKPKLLEVAGRLIKVG
jgi:hypothetical protein